MRLEAGQLPFEIQTVPLKSFVYQMFESYLAQLSPLPGGGDLDPALYPGYSASSLRAAGRSPASPGQ